MEKQVEIPFTEGSLEGLFFEASSNAALITHPHPLYGGEMRNSVVHRIARTYQKYNYSTLKFNFRGVGKSNGTHGNGIGEQEDISASLNFLISKNITSIDLVGYSFGAWVNYLFASKNNYSGRLILISPPIDFIDFEPVEDLFSLKLAIVGDRDDFVDKERLSKKMEKWNKDAGFHVLIGCDHFYSGCLDQLETKLEDFLGESNE